MSKVPRSRKINVATYITNWNSFRNS